MPAVATISSVIINCARLFDCKKYGAKLLYVFITLPSLTNQTSLVVVFFFFFFFFKAKRGKGCMEICCCVWFQVVSLLKFSLN
jgi:hypothetical protein